MLTDAARSPAPRPAFDHMIASVVQAAAANASQTVYGDRARRSGMFYTYGMSERISVVPHAPLLSTSRLPSTGVLSLLPREGSRSGW